MCFVFADVIMSRKNRMGGMSAGEDPLFGMKQR